MESYFHGVAPFGYVRVKACLAALRTLSWPTPSFIASYVPRHPSRALSRLSYLSIIELIQTSSLAALFLNHFFEITVLRLNFACLIWSWDQLSYSSILFEVLRIIWIVSVFCMTFRSIPKRHAHYSYILVVALKWHLLGITSTVSLSSF
jgi:hypothetical protein